MAETKSVTKKVIKTAAPAAAKSVPTPAVPVGRFVPPVMNPVRPVSYNNGFSGSVEGRVIPDAGMPTEIITGALDVTPDGHGIIRPRFSASDFDAYLSNSQIRRFRLRPGDMVSGPARKPKENERYWGLLRVDKVMGKTPAEMANRQKFSNMTPIYPDKLMRLETDTGILSTRLIDLAAPIGFGQRGLIVSPPKAGKTTIIKDISTGIAKNHPDVHLMAVLVGERPEEVTDIKRHVEAVTGGKGEVAASNFDETPSDQCRVAEVALERARRLVELGGDVAIVLDSITRLARAYNLAMPTSGRTLSGGFDPAALHPPKRFFGAARNFEEKGSLTIIGTALVDTGSRMDDLIYEEFKGTGNMELHLDRILADRRIFPSIDVQRSGTRKEELLFDASTYQSVLVMRRMIEILGKEERTQLLLERLKKTKDNKEFLAKLREG
jgi:transcription termination factor Rho